ncbi:hypothetical protein [Sporomusa malonica]|uniref:Uncharacterized protein n=1 Tax=Sporomusa malonica TaxID=112901 RepID=A0A1W1Z7A5_9FIRM|nr:hypothetical protein [Sporomusa malonica]SMC44256.1 hypothetical protein SAMN04488500_10352 [Sporomusa malonica]
MNMSSVSAGGSAGGMAGMSGCSGSQHSQMTAGKNTAATEKNRIVPPSSLVSIRD